jgi:hypothetical protein
MAGFHFTNENLFLGNLHVHFPGFSVYLKTHVVLKSRCKAARVLEFDWTFCFRSNMLVLILAGNQRGVLKATGFGLAAHVGNKMQISFAQKILFVHYYH